MRRPNILILYTDQQRWNTIAAAGNPEIVTPNLDRLVGAGMTFNHCYVQNPVCMPSRISFLTGQYPSALGIQHMGVPVPEDTPTLQRMLKNHGYYCANFGKLHFLPHANRDWRDPYPDYGFDELEVSDEPGCYEDDYRAWVRRVAPEALETLSLGLSPSARQWQATMGVRDNIRHHEGRDNRSTFVFEGPKEVTHSAWVADRTIDFLSRQRNGRPFLCIAGFFFPHNPWIVPQEFLSLYDRQKLSVPAYPPEWQAKRPPALTDEVLRGGKHGYYASISEVDHHVGRIMQALKDSGQADNTIVIFTSDHGEYLGDQMLWSKGPPAHDACLRVPLVITGPGIRPNTHTDALVEAVDIVPTLLEAVGVQTPAFVQGRSLWPVLSGSTGEHRPSALMEHVGVRNLRTRRFRYVAQANGAEALYDMEADFAEYRNVADDPAYASALADMRREMVRRMIEAEQPKRRSWIY